MNVHFEWHSATIQQLPSLGLPLALAFLAWAVRSITAGAALTGAFLTAVLCLAAGPASLVPVLAVFLLTYFSTQIGRRKKERLGTAERRKGRGAPQILANVSAAAICAAPLLFVSHPRYILLAGASAALAEAAADTVSSELGQVFGGTPRLITTGRPVAPGSDGAITIAGTLSAAAAAALVCYACQRAELLAPDAFRVVLAAAFLGTLLDSLLGATMERPERLGNNAVNFTSSAFSAGLAIVALFVRQ